MPYREIAADAHCCGCVPSLSLAGLGLAPAMSRRELIRGIGAALSMALAGCASIPEKHRVAASDIAREYGSVDLHAHPGMFRSSPLSMEFQVERMGRGRVSRRARSRLRAALC
jgi:hypothetical protein